MFEFDDDAFESGLVSWFENEPDFVVLTADKAEDIDKWPPLASLFPTPVTYDLYNATTKDLISEHHEMRNVLFIIKLFDPNEEDDFIIEFLQTRGYFYFFTNSRAFVFRKHVDNSSNK